MLGRSAEDVGSLRDSSLFGMVPTKNRLANVVEILRVSFLEIDSMFGRFADGV